MTDTQLRHKVAKLDLNVAFLCLSQKVDGSLVSVRQAVRNLMNLLNPSLESDLGRRGAVAVDQEFAATLSQLLDDDLALVQEEADSEEERDAQLDVDELGYESVPLWAQDGSAYDAHDGQVRPAALLFS